MLHLKTPAGAVVCGSPPGGPQQSLLWHPGAGPWVHRAV